MGAARSTGIVATLLAGSVGLAGPAAASATPEEDLTPVEELGDAVAVTSEYWALHFTETFGTVYVPPGLAQGEDGVPGFFDVEKDTATCGGYEVPVELAEGNAFYCYPDDYLVAEDELLDEAEVLGDALVYLVVAHEWGHAVQARIDPALVWVAGELQADCFAGAALGGAQRDGTLVWEEGDSEELESALTVAADDVPWTDVADHGSAEERIAAFDQGFAAGPLGCLPEE